MKVSVSKAKTIAKSINLNTDVIDIKTFKYALEVELEHGTKFGKITNVSNDDLVVTTKIVLAHLFEYPDYYERLKKMEEKADDYWSTRKKPKILLG